MLFNSFEFSWFFPLVAALYFLLPHRWRWLLLLVASYWFYMAWRAEYAVLLLASTVVDWFASHGIARAGKEETRRRWLIASIATNLGILFVFKYFDFINDSLRTLAGAAGMGYPVPDLDLLLPMGISFYTFQTMSYTIDVYRGQLAPASHPGRFALYVTFFPQLVAGPIERAPSLLPQFSKVVRWDHARVVSGLKQMLWGFFKKLVVADRVGVLVDHVYGSPQMHDGSTFILATLLFSLQIYCDFSGYSDIAIGAARVLGFDLMENFRTPYLSRSIREFWTRWHISLSTWFRDYVYIPLGGNRASTGRWYFNLFAVFLISGLWHGASWTFVLWGALHGIYLVMAIVAKPMWDRAYAALRIGPDERGIRLLQALGTFLLVQFSWLLFRADSIADAWLIAGRMWNDGLALGGIMGVVHSLKPGIVGITLLLAALFFVMDPWADAVAKGRKRVPGRWGAYLYHAALLACCLLFGHYGRTEFIYFQF